MPKVKKINKQQEENNFVLNSVMDVQDVKIPESATESTELKENNNSVITNEKEDNTVEKDIVQATQEELTNIIEENKQEFIEKKKENPEDTEIAVPGTDITKSKLEKMKKKYGKVFLSFYNDKAYVWHRLARKDFTKICEATEDIKDTEEMLQKREEEFCKICIVYPEPKEIEKDIEYEMTRVKMAQEILFRSGFYSPITQEL